MVRAQQELSLEIQILEAILIITTATPDRITILQECRRLRQEPTVTIIRDQQDPEVIVHQVIVAVVQVLQDQPVEEDKININFTYAFD